MKLWWMFSIYSIKVIQIWNFQTFKHSTQKEEVQIRWLIWIYAVPYFFSYKTEFFSFQNNPKNLDPSYKMDLDVWDCLGRVKPLL